MGPVLVITAFEPSRNVTVQPAGSVIEASVLTVLAARSYASACVLVLLTYSVNRAVLPGFTVCRSTNAASGPAPAPGAPGSGELFVTSTELAVIVVSTSVAVAVLAGLVADVGGFLPWVGAARGRGRQRDLEDHDVAGTGAKRADVRRQVAVRVGERRDAVALEQLHDRAGRERVAAGADVEHVRTVAGVRERVVERHRG